MSWGISVQCGVVVRFNIYEGNDLISNFRNVSGFVVTSTTERLSVSVQMVLPGRVFRFLMYTKIIVITSITLHQAAVGAVMEKSTVRLR